MADRPPLDLSKVIKKTAPLEDLVADDLKKERGKFNLTEEQWRNIGDGHPLSVRRGFFRRRSRRSSAA
ncbi:MAG TPA: hypothetical protein VL979_04595 [Solirubrobacteraceae bacterium]|nr:hypothetical protein [Solirubrobacteraceae bacterium]